MEIRKIENNRIPAALSLVWQTFLQFEAPDYSDEGVQSFKDFIGNEGIIKSMEFFGAYEGEELTGVIATRDNRKHIASLFVKARYHRQGIGRKLREHILRDNENSEITVNSSPFAVGFYHRLGFKDTDTEQLKDGIRYTPMMFKNS